MRRSQSRRNQRALEREMFGPEPSAPRPRPARDLGEPHCYVRGVLTPISSLPRPQIGACPFCANTADVAPGHAWECLSCGARYVHGNLAPVNLLT